MSANKATYAVLGIEDNNVQTSGTSETNNSGVGRPWCYIKVSDDGVWTKHQNRNLERLLYR